MNDLLANLATEVDNLSDEKTSIKTTKKIASEDNVEEKKVSVMDQLLAKSPIEFPSIGDTIIGIVLEVSTSEIYLDLGPFGAGLVLGKEIKDGMGTNKLKIGDKVSATVTDLENEEGYIELSIREASYEKAWEDVEKKRDAGDKIKTKIISANKGGLLIEINGISGFLPVSQLASKNYPRVEDGDKNKILNLLKKLVGKELEVCVIDIDREADKLIASEKAAQSEKEKETIANFSMGDIISGEISGVVDFGAFVKFSPANYSGEISEKEKVEGLVHISELAWQLIENPRTIVKVGDKVDAKIIGIDNDKISLSIRALQADPWSEAKDKYKMGDIVTGKVHKINHFGAFVYLDNDIHGLAHISEILNAHPEKTINDLIKVGGDYSWKILSMEPREHRMGLTLIDANKEKKSAKEKVEKTEEEVKTAKKEKKAKKTDEEIIEKKEKKVKKENNKKEEEKNKEDSEAKKSEQE